MSDLRQLVGKRVLMTGGAANIGRATAILLARHGARVVIGDLDAAGAAQTVALVESEGGQASSVETDVTDEHAVRALVAHAVDEMGGLDVAFLNAGLQRSGPVDEFPVDEWDALFAVNPRHCFLGAKHVTPHLREGGGSIVLMASLAGLRGGPGMTAYSASKGAIVGFAKALAAELAPHSIRVNTICPGWIDTPFNQPAIDFMGGRASQESVVEQIVPLARQGTPQEIAAGVLFLASDASSYMTGQNLVIDGGVN